MITAQVLRRSGILLCLCLHGFINLGRRSRLLDIFVPYWSISMHNCMNVYVWKLYMHKSTNKTFIFQTDRKYFYFTLLCACRNKDVGFIFVYVCTCVCICMYTFFLANSFHLYSFVDVGGNRVPKVNTA